MNRNNRFIRAAIAAKRAFMNNTMPPAAKPAAPKANNPVTHEQKADEPYVLSEHPITIDDLKRSYCTGCGACYNVCPVGAITTRFDEHGFIEPVIDYDKCIKCRKCAKTCPVINTHHKNTSSPEGYAVMANDEIRRDSSSGGMFTLVAEHILDNGGYVCGAVFADDFSVEHIIINSKDELHRLRGSKYVQSNTKKVFTKIKQLLDDGSTVLFSGCPCQVAGLYGYLGKDYKNLYTLDLVCHGAPSQKVFLKYLDETYGRENLAGFKFRTKEYGYNSFNQIAYLKDGTQVGGNIKFDFYEKTMHSGLALKDVCGDCMFAGAPRQGDISIGDCWGVSKFNKDYNDNRGTSAVLVNNEKGRKLFDTVTAGAKLVEKVPYDFMRQNNRFGRKMRIPGGRRWFFTMLEGQSFAKSAEYALNRRFDVGVIGLWYGRNYGSMATYFALHQVLTKLFHLSVLMIDNPLRPDTEAITKTHPRKIAERFYDVSKKYRLEDLQMLNNNCDTFIVGSDQLWNIHLSRPYGQMYYLGFAGEMNKKIAYGTSFGIPYSGNNEEKMISAYNLKRFDHVSVRDEMSHDIAENTFGVQNVTEVCDPTFLCPVEEYDRLTELAEQKQESKYILAYILDTNERIGEQLKKLAEDTGSKIVVLLDEPPKFFERNRNNLNIGENENIIIKNEITLYDWMWHYKNADAVVTDSFHGTIFSLIFNKPFITLTNVRRGAGRFVSLLTPIGLRDRLFDSPEAITENEKLLDGLDYTEPNRKLGEIRDKSMSWLENALFSTKKFNSKGIFRLSDNKLSEQDK